MRRLAGIGIVSLIAMGAAHAQPLGVYTTKEPAAPPAQGLPWLQQQQQQLPSGYRPSVPGPGDIPFQRATPYGAQAVPGPLPMNQSVPVESIDGIEMTEPAAPMETVLEANPVEEDPAMPTELTSPLFAADPDTKAPRTIVLRVLNKVTARAEEITAKPGDAMAFGKLQIEAVQGYRSARNSQPDSVALLSIHEKQADLKDEPTTPKLLFHGWMYASSPSLTALEHPIYDVTMVDCRMKNAPADGAEKGNETAE